MVRNLVSSRFQALIASSFYRTMLTGLALVFALCVAGHLQAQTTGTLTGVVKDSTGAIIPGAKVILVNTREKSTRSTTSNGEAFFSFAAVQASTYDLNITLDGFEAYKITGIEIHPGDSKTITTIALKIGRQTESVTVSSTVAGVELGSGDKAFNITEEDIKRLSTVGRDVSELIRTLPGFAVSGAGLNNDSTNNASQVAGFSSSAIGSFAANGAGPGTGAVAVVSDGANTTDPADASSSIGNVNMEMVAEVKVQTSNFGADSAKGPVVLNAISKSGGTNFHGSVYGYARNSALNSNDWIDNYYENPRAGTYNYYPGGNIGGPIVIPHTNFNHNKKLHFFAGAEGYDQRNLFNNTATLSFVPTDRMLTGDFSPASIEQAFNLPSGASLALCPTRYGCDGLNNSGAGFSPDGVTYDVQGHTIANGQLPVADFDPNAAAYTRFYPKPNRVPQPQGNPPAGTCTDPTKIRNSVTNKLLLSPGEYCSDSINYDTNIFAQHNGFQIHGKVDQDISDATKLYVTYDYEKVSDQSPVTNTYYAGSPQNIIPSPVGSLSNAYAHRVTLNQTQTFGPTLTNEAQVAGVYFHSPAQLQSTKLLTDENSGFVGPRFYANGADQLPEIINYQGGVPDFAMGYFNPNFGAPKRKYSVNISDNITKQLQRHSLKAGVYLEQSANNEYVQNYNDPQGQLSFSSYNSCNTYSMNGTANSPAQSNLGNSVANFLNGCGGFTQVNKFQSGDMKFKTIDVFVQDEWKATKKLTITVGIRFDHLGPWVDAHGQGLAVWEPSKITQNVVYKLDPTDPTTWPGIAWHNGKGTTLDASLPLSGVPSRFLFYSPRAGVAYDLYGDGRTTLRGGWGAYRFHDSYYTSDGPLLTALGVTAFSTPGNVGCTLSQIGNSGALNRGQTITPLGSGPFANPAGQICGGTSNPFAIQAAAKQDDQQPVTYNYSFNVDQQLGHNSLLELSYVGNQTQHSLTGGNGGVGQNPNYTQDLRDQNAIPLGGLYKPNPNTSSPSYGQIAPIQYFGNYSEDDTQNWRPYPNYANVIVQNHIAYSNYNSIQAAYIKQRGSLTFNLNYTWSKALGVRGQGYGAVGDSFNIRNDYGLLPFNRKQAVNITFSYQEGTKFHGNRFVGGFLNNWEASGITSLQSGPDVAAFNSNFGLSGGYSYQPEGQLVPVNVQYTGIVQLGTPNVTVQPVLTCDPKQHLPGINSSGAKAFINGDCFSLPQPGTNGSFHLPDVHGPSYFDSDITLFKNFKIKEGQSLQFRAAGFNFLNHPNYQIYGGPAAGLNLGFGQNLSRNLATNLTNYPTSDAAARASLVQTSTNFGSTPYKSSLRIVELGFKYSF